MPKFRKKPVVIEATQWFKNGDHPLDHYPIGISEPSAIDIKKYQEDIELYEGKIVRRFRNPLVFGGLRCRHCNERMHNHGWIDSFEGGHIVCVGDWIITGENGEFYPCKPEIFEKTYEEVVEEPPMDNRIAYESSEIQWIDAIWDPWYGCHKVSPGCKYCYMFRDAEIFRIDPTQVVRSEKFKDPLFWRGRKKIFTCSRSDFFIEEADFWRSEAWEIIKETPHHTYQILTKRPERIMQCLPPDWGEGYDNVWLGVSIGCQSEMYRFNQLIEVPSKIRFIAFEPIFERIDLNMDVSDLIKIHWAIIGGESGNSTGEYRYRKCELEWIESLVSDLSPIPIFIKKLGAYLANKHGLKHKYGGDISEFPEHLKLRQLPLTKQP